LEGNGVDVRDGPGQLLNRELATHWRECQRKFYAKE
jgi:hypothetical protein